MIPSIARRCMSLVLAVLSACANMNNAADDIAVTRDQIEGLWYGTLPVTAGALRLALHITVSNSSLVATIDSLDQHVLGIPASISFHGSRVVVDVPSVHGAYRGEVNPSARTMTGVWEQAGAQLRLQLQKVPAIPQVSSVSEPARPFPYVTREVVVDVEPGVRLAGTLTYPKRRENFPGVVLLGGSGTHDRDYTLFGRKPYLFLADYLSRKGFATLRMDDRGVGGSTGDAKGTLLSDRLQDVNAALAFLRAQPSLDVTRTGIIGHSEGGLIAAVAALSPGGPNFLVLMATPSLPVAEQILAQERRLLENRGVGVEQVKKALEALRGFYVLLCKNAANADFAKYLNSIGFATWKALGFDAPEQGIEKLNALRANQHLRDLLRLDPQEIYSRLAVPTLMIYGSVDTQVPASANAKAGKALALNNCHLTVLTIADVNHLLQDTTNGDINAYPRIDSVISRKVLKTVGAWLERLPASPTSMHGQERCSRS